MDELWKGILWRQFGAALDMFENALRACSAELWGRRMWVQYPEFSEFWYVAYHIALLGRLVPGWRGGGLPAAGAVHDE